MRTLLERLKPEILKAIELDDDLYPNLISSIKIELSEECFTGDLKVRTGFNICLYNNTNFGYLELANCFEKE